MSNVTFPNVDEFAKLIPLYQNAQVLRQILNAFYIPFYNVFMEIKKDFEMLNIDKCSGEYLDNLGKLLGINRPIRDLSFQYLKADSLYQSLDFSSFYVKNASTDEKLTLVNDDVYRKFIKSQIIRNNYNNFSINTMEQIIDLILGENLPILRIDSIATNDKMFKVTVTTDNSMSHFSRAFLQSRGYDKLDRKIWDFPWPPRVKEVNIVIVNEDN